MNEQNYFIQISKPELQTIINNIVNSVLENQPETETKTDELITRQQAAEMIGVTLPTLHRYTQNGVIPTYRIGRNVRFKKSEIIESLSKVESIKYRRA